MLLSSSIINSGAEFEFEINRHQQLILVHPTHYLHPHHLNLLPSTNRAASAPPLVRGMWAMLLITQRLNGRIQEGGTRGAGSEVPRCVARTRQTKVMSRSRFSYISKATTDQLGPPSLVDTPTPINQPSHWLKCPPQRPSEP